MQTMHLILDMLRTGYLQFCAQSFEKNYEIKQNQTKPKNFYICFCIIFFYFYLFIFFLGFVPKFISAGYTGLQAVFPCSFGIMQHIADIILSTIRLHHDKLWAIIERAALPSQCKALHFVIRSLVMMVGLLATALFIFQAFQYCHL